MREILFRGKRIDNGEWVEGQYAYLLNPRTEDGGPIKHMIVDGTPFGHTVDLATVGQYTGLTDKNGRKIFEGDILREPAKNDWEKKNFVGFEVFWHDNDSCDRHIGWQMNLLHFYGAISGADIYPISFRPAWAKSMVVIGNIHDNELLEENEMAELKPCPFCGMSASVWKHKYPSGDTYYEPLVWHESGCVLDHVIWCGDYETEDDLAAAWNRRAGEDG